MSAFVLRLVALLAFLLPVAAAEPLLRPHDVIALVGGEDMVAASEYGYLELLLTRARPDYQLRFRNLAWEGDTVFEQRRDLNFPPLEAQLDKIGATVVIAQFGQMESLSGKEKLPEFIMAYEKLIERMSAGGKRRVALITPERLEDDSRSRGRDWLSGDANLEHYQQAIVAMGKQAGLLTGDISQATLRATDFRFTRDGVHANEQGQIATANTLARVLLDGAVVATFPAEHPGELAPLRDLIRAKNRLWFHYWRPQNWAFLNGDRTAQPSSRDHLDPSKRWFPEEIEQFIPLIEAKEREIDMLAAKLAQP